MGCGPGTPNDRLSSLTNYDRHENLDEGPLRGQPGNGGEGEADLTATLLPSRIHPLVRTHPETGRKALYIGNHTQSLKGFTEAEARPILDYLKAHAVQPELTCRFAWAPGSMAIWDNRCTQHRALNDYPGQRRRMHRITIAGDATH